MHANTAARIVTDHKKYLADKTGTVLCPDAWQVEKAMNIVSGAERPGPDAEGSPEDAVFPYSRPAVRVTPPTMAVPAKPPTKAAPSKDATKAHRSSSKRRRS